MADDPLPSSVDPRVCLEFPTTAQIIACAEMLTRQYGLTGYRYASEESHRIVERWWLERAGNAADKKTADKEDHD